MGSVNTEVLDKELEKEELKEDNENLLEKKTHTVGEGCSLFRNHTWLFFLYVLLLVNLVIFGVLLIIFGNWANSGLVSFYAIINSPWPKIELEEENETVFAIEFLQLSCWISGFFFCLFAIYDLYVLYVYYKLLWPSYPWNSNNWNNVRLSGNRMLVKSKVRDESTQEQFERMNSDQKEMMQKYKKSFIDPAKFSS